MIREFSRFGHAATPLTIAVSFAASLTATGACGTQRELHEPSASRTAKASGSSANATNTKARPQEETGKPSKLAPGLHAVHEPVLNDAAREARQKAQFRLMEATPFGDVYMASPRVLERELSAEELAERALKAEEAAAAGEGQTAPAGVLTPMSPLDRGADGPEQLDLDSLPGSAGPNPDRSTPAGSAKIAYVDAHSLGRYVPMEGAGDGGLAGFHQALRQLQEHRRRSASADGAPPRKVRVAFYGSSQTAADFITHYLRVYLQGRFGDGGHGFVALAKPWKYYRHLDVGVKTSRGWHTDHAQKSNRRTDGYYGLMGASTSASKRRQRSTITARGDAQASHFEVLYLNQPRGGRFSLEINGVPKFTVKTRAKQASVGFLEFDLPRELYEFGVYPKGDGEVRLFGMVMENDQSGVVLDTLGINGARAANHLMWDEPMWREQFRRRAPNLYVLAYGANEAMDVDQPIEDYARDLEAVLDRFAVAAPDASCLLVGPGDFPQKGEDGVYRPRPRLRKIKAAQKRIAQARGCAFWDSQGFMGGEMGISQWVAAEPKMASEDHLHLTRRGYTRMGMALADAMLHGFDKVEAAH